MILTADPMLTASQVREILRTTAVKIDRENTDPIGRWNNGFSQWYGYGRVDAAAAVEHAMPSNGVLDTDFDRDGVSEIPVTSPWGMGLLRYNGTSLDALAMAPDNSLFDGWRLSTNDNRLEITADLDGDGAAEYLVTSPWGIGILGLEVDRFVVAYLASNGTRVGGWLLNTADNRF